MLQIEVDMCPIESLKPPLSKRSCKFRNLKSFNSHIPNIMFLYFTSLYFVKLWVNNLYSIQKGFKLSMSFLLCSIHIVLW